MIMMQMSQTSIVALNSNSTQHEIKTKELSVRSYYNFRRKKLMISPKLVKLVALQCINYFYVGLAIVVDCDCHPPWMDKIWQYVLKNPKYHLKKQLIIYSLDILLTKWRHDTQFLSIPDTAHLDSNSTQINHDLSKSDKTCVKNEQLSFEENISNYQLSCHKGRALWGAINLPCFVGAKIPFRIRFHTYVNIIYYNIAQIITNLYSYKTTTKYLTRICHMYNFQRAGIAS